MAINFNHLSSTPSTNSRDKVDTQAPQANSNSTQTGTENANSQSTVQLSNEALALQKLEEQVGKLPDINNGRIAVIKAALEEGSYTIDAESIAAKMLSFEEQLANAGEQ